MKNAGLFGGAIAAIATLVTALPAQAGNFSFGVAPTYSRYPRAYPTRLNPVQRGFDQSSPRFLERLDPARSRSIRPSITFPSVILQQRPSSQRRRWRQYSDYPRSIYRQPAYPGSIYRQGIYPNSIYQPFGYPQRSRSTTIIIGPTLSSPRYPSNYPYRY